MPQAGLDNATMRNIEIGDSAFKEIKQDAEKISGDIESFFRRDFKNATQADITLINRAMEGDLLAKNEVRIRSEGLANSLDNFTNLVKKVRTEIDDPRLQISDELKTIYGLKENYVRDIFEKFTKRGRQDFDIWKKDATNQETITKFRNLALTDVALGKK